MFIRRTRYRLAPGADGDEGQARFEREMRARLSALPGLISSSHLPEGDGWWYVVALWHSREEAEAALPEIDAEWARQSDRLAGGPIREAGGVTLVPDG